uniref:Uncharacterized protein n=1 Tax=Oryza meridionalis TaxID=40149 RepID=A0A0E0D3F0_9ORYZ
MKVGKREQPKDQAHSAQIKPTTRQSIFETALRPKPRAEERKSQPLLTRFLLVRRYSSAPLPA